LAAGLVGDAAAAPQPKALLGTKGNVVRIAADGSRVALITTAVPKSCDRIVLWNAQTRAVATWQTGIDCAGGAISGGQTVTEVAVAGQRVAWVEEAAGNLEDLQLRTAVPGGKPKEVDFAENGNGDEEAPDGEYLGNVFGQGSLLVYNTWSLCALIRPVPRTTRPCYARTPRRSCPRRKSTSRRPSACGGSFRRSSCGGTRTF
jgi:hypothetical protein